MIKLVNKIPAEGMMLDVNELEQNFIKTRMEKFGETEEQAQQSYKFFIAIVGIWASIRAARYLANYYKAIK